MSLLGLNNTQLASTKALCQVAMRSERQNSAHLICATYSQIDRAARSFRYSIARFHCLIAGIS
jgi:hypothetical protein